MAEEIKYVTLAEVKEFLEEENEARGELNHEQGFALQHARTTARLPGKRARSIVEELMALDGVNAVMATTIVDITPTHEDDIHAVFSKERFEISEETVAKIMEICKENF